MITMEEMESALDARARIQTQFMKGGAATNEAIDTLINETKVATVDSSGSSMSIELDFVSLCEHHIMPMIGKLDIDVTNAKYWIGAKNYQRIVDLASHRPTTQDEVVYTLAILLFKSLQCEKIYVECRAIHACTALKTNKFQFITVSKEIKK